MLNPWKVQNIYEFNYYCCPECVFRSKEDMSFQAHALQNHVLSKTFFHSVEDHNADHANELENSEVGLDAMEEEDFEEKFDANEDEKQFEIHQNDQELEDTNEDLQVKEEELEIEPDIPIEDDLQGD